MVVVGRLTKMRMAVQAGDVAVGSAALRSHQCVVAVAVRMMLMLMTGEVRDGGEGGTGSRAGMLLQGVHGDPP